MAYDPQANRRRPQPDAAEPAPVDALLGDQPAPAAPTGASQPVADDPPPSPAVTPEPADPVSDTLVFSSTVFAAIGAAVAAFVARHLWLRRRRRSDDD